MASRAASTHSRGTAASGTGTATHSSLGFSTKVLRYTPPWLTTVRHLLNHQMPYLLDLSSLEATSGATNNATSSKVWGLYTSSRMRLRRNVLLQKRPPF